MSYPIDITIPAANNDPADDQPIMLQNTVNTVAYLTVDHVAPGATGNGYHKHVTFNDKIAAPALSGPMSCAFTATGTADPTHPELVWQNTAATYPISAIKAFGSFTTVLTPGPPSIDNSYNAVSITGFSDPLGISLYTVNLTPGALFGNPPLAVVVTGNSFATAVSYILSANTVTLLPVNPAAAQKISFVVLQF